MLGRRVPGNHLCWGGAVALAPRAERAPCSAFISFVNDEDGHGGAKEEKDDTVSVDYSQFTVAKLKERCRERGLLVLGTKAVLLQRVTDDLKADLRRQREKEEEESKRRMRNNSSTPTMGQGTEYASRGTG